MRCPKCDSFEFRPILVQRCTCCKRPMPLIEFNEFSIDYCEHCFEEQFGRVRSSAYACSECKHKVNGNNELITSGKCVCDNCGVQFRPFPLCHSCELPLLPHQATLEIANAHNSHREYGHNTIHKWCWRQSNSVMEGLFRASLPLLGMIAFALWVLWYIFTH